eukprot:5815713-Pleurochrysis_carterae.AAC.3
MQHALQNPNSALCDTLRERTHVYAWSVWLTSSTAMRRTAHAASSVTIPMASSMAGAVPTTSSSSLAAGWPATGVALLQSRA